MPYTNCYDYEDDSDFEDDDDDIVDEESPQVVTKKPRDDSDIAVLENSDAKINDSSDIVSVSDFDSLFSDSSDTKGEPETSTSRPLTSARSSSLRMWPLSRASVSLPLDACAEITCNRFQAMLRYLYTDEIEFAPWGSVERRKARALEEISESYGIPKPSPKSVYRLADKVTSSHVSPANSD